MKDLAAVRRVVVFGRDGHAVGKAVRSARGPQSAVAGFVGDDDQAARAMGEEMLGGVDALVAAREEGAADEA